MPYEFRDEPSTGDVPTTPEFWHLQAERICQLMVSEPAFANYNSVVEDPKTGQLGLDTNDPLPYDDNLFFEGPRQSVGIMRYAAADLRPSGFLVDMRYAQTTLSRALDFDQAVYQNEDPNERFRTEAPLGVIFADPDSGELSLRSPYRNDARVQHFAQSLMQFVDAERAKRNAEVLDPAGRTDKAAVNQANLHVPFSGADNQPDQPEQS